WCCFRARLFCSLEQELWQPSYLLLGAGCLVAIVLTHLCEAFDLFPWMGRGLPDSVGHYLDLGSAVLGFTLFPIGYLGTPSQTGPDPCSPEKPPTPPEPVLAVASYPVPPGGSRHA